MKKTDQDASRIDNFLQLAGDSLPWAVAACQFVLNEPGDTLDQRMLEVLGCSSETASVYECIMTHKLKRPDDLGLQANVVGKEQLVNMVSAATTSWREGPVPHRLMALRCFKTMREMLRFNIFGIEGSDVDSKDMDPTIRRHMPPFLVYACVNWASCASIDPFHSSVVTALDGFVGRDSFHWLEVMSMLQQNIPKTLQVLEDAIVSVDQHNTLTKTQRFFRRMCKNSLFFDSLLTL